MDRRRACGTRAGLEESGGGKAAYKIGVGLRGEGEVHKRMRRPNGAKRARTTEH